MVLANSEKNNRSDGYGSNGATGKHSAENFDPMSAKLTHRFKLISVSPRGATPHFRRYDILECNLQNPLQVIADTVFILFLCLVVGTLVNLLFRGLFIYGIGQFWCSTAIALSYAVVERARVSDNGVAATDRRSRAIDGFIVWTLAFAGLIFVNFALRINADLSRVYLAVLYVAGALPLMLWRAFAPALIEPAYHRMHRRNWVVLGDNSSSALRGILDELNAGASPPPSVIKFDSHCSEERWALEQNAVLSTAYRALQASSKGAIYLCSAGIAPYRLASLCSNISKLPVSIYIIPDNEIAGLIGCTPRIVGRHLALELRRAPLGIIQRAMKRLIDVVIGSLALVMLSPLFLVIAICISMDSSGPIFFRQNRTGQGGKQFRIYKFRSMYVAEDGPTIQQACRNDPRVTKVGRYLRASSIDELPQLLNVLKGEMSLVGPRPHAVAHDKYYSKLVDNYELRQHVKPGITGWAQAKGYRGETTDVELMRKRIEHDSWYAQNASVLLDLEIIARTFVELLRSRNAY